MAAGHAAGAYHGHNNVDECIVEWQRHCVLGIHPHPADPAWQAAPPVSPKKLVVRRAEKSGSALIGTGRAVDPKLQAEM